MNAIKEKINLEEVLRSIRSEELEVHHLVKLFEEVYAEILINLKSKPVHSDEPLEAYNKMCVEFEWAEEAKQLAVLMRDIVFSRYKDIQEFKDGFKDEKMLHRHRREEAETFEFAFQETFKMLANINNQKNTDDNKVEAWKHLKSPVVLYAEQILLLRDQMDLMIDATSQLNDLRGDIATNLENIKKNFEILNVSCTSLCENIKNSKEKLNQLSTSMDFEGIGPMIVDIEKTYKKIENSRPDPPFFHFTSDKKADVKIPVRTDEAQLEVKDINFSDQINNWIESELYASYQNEKSLIDGLFDTSLITLFNTKNRLSLIQSDGKENFPKDLTSLVDPVISLDTMLTDTDTKIEAFSSEVTDRLDKTLITSAIFSDDKIFLPFEDSLGYLDIRKGRKWIDKLPFGKVREGFNSLVDKIFFKGNDTGNALSSTIKFTDEKKLPQEHEPGNSLFFSRGYMGQSFYINRVKIEQKILDTYEYWQKGFGGSVLLYGTRLSGRSSILQSLNDIISDTDIIYLKPNRSINYLGRKHEPDYNLRGTLEFLNKHSITNRIIVAIDDIELWRNEHFSFYQNMVSLQEAISKNGKRIFFIASTNNWMKDHLDSHLGFSEQFIVRINCSQMGINNIISAIKIRHAATFQSTLLESGDVDFERSVKRAARKLAVTHDGNIGASLNEWGRNTAKYGEEISSFNIIKMPDVVARHLEHNRLILTHLFKFRQSSEIELRSMIGDTFVREITQRIQLLIGLGVLNRKLNGIFSINQMVVNDIETLLFKQHGKLSKVYE